MRVQRHCDTQAYVVRVCVDTCRGTGHGRAAGGEGWGLALVPAEVLSLGYGEDDSEAAKAEPGYHAAVYVHIDFVPGSPHVFRIIKTSP